MILTPPTCPRCQHASPVEVSECSTCGFGLVVADQRYGAEGVVMARINDAGGVLKPVQRARLEKQLRRFERTFPQLFLAVFLGEVESESELREFGFWLLNRAAVAGVEITRPNENGLLLLADPECCLVGLVLGTQVETLLPEFVLQAVLREARDPLRRRGMAAGLRCVVNGLIRELKRRVEREEAGPPPVGSGGPLAGLRRLRLGRRPASDHPLPEAGE